MSAAMTPDPWTTALPALGGPLPTERTQFDRWEDQGWTGPDDEDEARAVLGGGAW